MKRANRPLELICADVCVEQSNWSLTVKVNISFSLLMIFLEKTYIAVPF